jgi:probable rRNA maturation factor
VKSRPLDDEQVREAVQAALRAGGRPTLAVDVVLIGDRRLRALHRCFLGDDTPTDVMAFDLADGGLGPAAEIYASVTCARRVARARGVSAARELALYLVHGALHLCGHDDHRTADRRRMRRAERRILTALGYRDDPAPHDAD